MSGTEEFQDLLINTFVAYIMDPSPEKEIEINVQLLDRAVKAAEHLAPNLKFVVLPTGTKVRIVLTKLSAITDTSRHMESISSKNSRSPLLSRNR